MTLEPYEVVLEEMRSRGARIDAGLSATELDDIEAELHVKLPIDLRRFLSVATPAGPGFPDWRSPRSEQMLEWFDEPSEGVEFDVEENGVWLDRWGEKPEDIDHAVDEVHRLVNAAPQLIPLYGHQYLPARPVEGGSPVLSVEGTDVAIVAPNLDWWFHHEWGAPAPEGAEPEPSTVPFWSDLLG